MQKRSSHNKILSEMPQPNNYYVMPKSLRYQLNLIVIIYRFSSQKPIDDQSFRKATSSNTIECHEHLNHPEMFQNSYQHGSCCQTNLEFQQALRYSEFNYQQLQRSHSQLQQNNIDLQTLYTQSEQQNKQLRNEFQMLQNSYQQKENECRQMQDTNLLYAKETAQQKVQIQKLNSTINKLTEELQQCREKNLDLNSSNFIEKGLSSRREKKGFSEFDINDSIISEAPKNRSVYNQQSSQKSINENIQNYQKQILQYQKDLADKNSLISGLQQQVMNLTDFQRQLMQKSPKKMQLKGMKPIDQSSPQVTPIPKITLQNESQIMSNQNLLHMMDDQGKSDNGRHKTRQSDEIDINPSVRSTITNTKSKQELSSIYKKINQSTIYTAGLYSSLLDYQYLSKNLSNCKLLSASNSKDCLQS